MFKKLLLPGLLAVVSMLSAQNNSELYILPWNGETGKAQGSAVRNISQNPGYDNQLLCF
ncbi:hypothetical protein [Aureicoccus marinus]|uniref:hypothetical protein n=1 Tax=Aureicoccus marinus TaxID=754435 RepID=UPI0015E49275|nr:hypothetical protein [Aureicoccus marinus]